MQKKIIIKTPQQIDNIRTAGKYLTELLSILRHSTKVGMALIELEEIAQAYIVKHNLKGSFKWFNGFPTNLCLSVNDCVVHGIPNRYVLRTGDLLKIDCGITINKCIADAAVGVVVWWDIANPISSDLLQATKQALDIWLEHIAPHKKMIGFSQAVYTYIKQKGFTVMRTLTGHGVGTHLHEPPYIYNYPHPSMEKIHFMPGMVIALEPITAEISTETIEDPHNHRNLYTEKRDLGAQREYTVVITDTWYEILAWCEDY